MPKVLLDSINDIKFASNVVLLKMINLAEIVERIELKVNRLLSQNKFLKQNEAELKAQLEKRDQEITVLKAEISSLELTAKNLKTANALLGSNEYKRETKLKINSLIKEIDECIVQLAE